jgi:nucleotide-binding universal stress UspA family protein
MSRIVITAGSASRAKHAANQALALLGGGHRVIILLVVRPSLVAAPVSDGGDAGAGRLALSDETQPEAVLASADRAEADARSELDDEFRQLHLDARVRVRVETGEPGETVCRVAADERADLIVLGRHSRSRWRMLLGSVTHYVLEHAHCPVLVVHEDDDA